MVQRGRGGRGRRQRELDRGGMKRTGEAPVCLLRTGLFLPCVEFWQAAPVAWIRQPAFPWQGRRDDTPSLGKGARGLECWGAWVARGRGLTEGYKYPWQPDDHTVSQLETDGKLWRDTWLHSPPRDTPHKHKLSPPPLTLFLFLSLKMMVAG